MKKFNISFIGRQKNAIGILYKINTTVEIPKESTYQEVKLRLYDNYEHISFLKINN